MLWTTDNNELSLGNVDDISTRHAIQQIYDEVVTGKKEMETEVRDQKNVVHDMNERLRDTERYLSKDCLMIKNPLFDARKNTTFIQELLKFLSCI